MNILPVFVSEQDGFSSVNNGIFYSAPKICMKRLYAGNEECIKHYKIIADTPNEIVKCPLGFNSYLLEQDDVSEIFTGMVIRGYSSPSVNGKSGDEDYKASPIMKERFDHILRHETERIVSSHRAKELDSYIDSVFHDIRTYNASVVHKMDSLYPIISQGRSKNNGVGKRKVKKKINLSEKHLDYMHNIWAMSSFISRNLDSILVIRNPEYFNKKEDDVITFTSMHGCFYKMKECLKDNHNDVYIDIIGHGYDIPEVKLNQDVEYIPAYLLENAIKYAPNNSNVLVDFKLQRECFTIEVESYGPYTQPEEVVHLFDYKFRGAGAKQKTGGSGIGLFSFASICKANDIKYEAIVNKKENEINGNTYYSFKIKMTFKLSTQF